MIERMSIQDLESNQLRGKRVLVRVDFNVPIQAGVVGDDTRIRESLPTIRYLIEQQAKVILLSHLGRPKGIKDKIFSLEPVSRVLSHLLGQPVTQAEDCIGEEVSQQVSALEEGHVLMLENSRFYQEEMDNDPVFSQQLASLAELYVQDAFGVVHREHASTVGVAAFLPMYAGLLVQKELAYLGRVVDSPVSPFVAIIGGAKVSTKLGVLKHLLDKVDTLIIGGGMAFTFLKAKGIDIGTSLCEDDQLDEACLFLTKAKTSRTKVVFPVDQVVADAFSDDANTKVVEIEAIPEGMMGLDIGPETVQDIEQIVIAAKTVLWNGPLGVFEKPLFAHGTKAVAKAVAKTEAVTIVGGGDSVAAVNQAGLGSYMSHISTGGGASLAFLEGDSLPGVEVLKERQHA